WRRIPWLRGTALIFCDVYTEEGEPIEEAPRWVLRRQVERAAKAGYVVNTASELELYLFRESFDEARAERFHALTRAHAGVGLLRGLPHPPDYQGGGAGPGHPQRHGRGGRAGRVLQGRVGQGA